MHNDARNFSDDDTSQAELRIATNRGGIRVFCDLDELRDFSIQTARDLATLATVIEDSNLDATFIAQTLGLLNDLAFQLQQCVELTCGKTAT